MHHKSYVNGLNRAELELFEARHARNFEMVKHWSRELAFNGSGHILHSIFWTVMAPGGADQPGPLTMNQIGQMSPHRRPDALALQTGDDANGY